MNVFRPALHPRSRGFTLVELLVAMAVLSIMGLALAQVLSLSLQTWQEGRIRANCYTKARVVLDAVTADIQRGVFRPDLKNFPSSSATPPTFTFYTRAAGMSTGGVAARPVSLVTYQLSSNLQGYLLRSENTINWGNGSNLNFLQQLTPVAAAGAPSAGPPNDLLSTGVVDFEMIFLLADGTTVLAKDYQSPTTSPVVMIGVAVAVIDDGVMTQLRPGAFGTLQKSILEGTLPSTPMTTTTTAGVTTYSSSATFRSIKEVWDQNLTTLYANNGYPKSLAVGFKTFEQFVPCTPFN